MATNNIVNLNVATQAQQETGTELAAYVAPGVQHYHASAAKAWGFATVAAGTPTLQSSYNLTSITDTGVGVITFTIATDFSSVNVVSIISGTQGSGIIFSNASEPTAGVSTGVCFDVAPAVADPTSWAYVGYGDQ